MQPGSRGPSRVMVESLDFVLSMRGNPVRNHPQPQETPATKPLSKARSTHSHHAEKGAARLAHRPQFLISTHWVLGWPFSRPPHKEHMVLAKYHRSRLPDLANRNTEHPVKSESKYGKMLTMAVGFLMYFLQRFGIFENFHNQILGFKKNESLTAEKGKVLKWPQTKTPLLIVKFEFNHLSLLQHLP